MLLEVYSRNDSNHKQSLNRSQMTKIVTNKFNQIHLAPLPERDQATEQSWM